MDRHKRVIGLASFICLCLISPGSTEASSIYYLDTGLLEIRNDSNPDTYVSLESHESCRVPIISDSSNVFPWGENAGYVKLKWPLGDQPWPEASLKSIVARIQSWAKLSDKQKYDGINPSLKPAYSACIKLALKESMKKSQQEQQCRSQNKSFKETKRGRLCLSDFEYAQLLLLEEQAETSQKQQYERQLLQVQQQELQMQQNRTQQEEMTKQQQRQFALDLIMKSRPKNCYGSVFGGGGYSTFNTTCY